MKSKKEIVDFISKIYFSYSSIMEYEYERNTAYDHEERCANDYCRCITLENFELTSVSAKEFMKYLNEYSDFDKCDFEKEFIKICDKMTSYDFDFNVSGGYYGEELDSVSLSNPDIINEIANLYSIKAYRSEKIKRIESTIKEDYILDEYVKNILIKEYGYVLDSLKKSKFKIIEINTKDIVFPQVEYNDIIKSQNLGSYKNKKGVCGLVKLVGDK